MKPTLKVTVSGQCASGKTTLVIALAQFLKKHGFDVDVDDIDINLGTHHPALQHERMVVVARSRKVTLTSEATK